MTRWLRRLRGAIGMGVSWAFVWALGVVVLGVATLVFPGLEIIWEASDDELMIMAIPTGFMSGVVFSGVLGVAGRRKRFDELSVPRVAGWGAIGGGLLGLLPSIAVSAESLVAGAMALTGAVTLSAVSATLTLLVARRAEDKALLDATSEVASAGLTPDETKELLGP